MMRGLILISRKSCLRSWPRFSASDPVNGHGKRRLVSTCRRQEFGNASRQHYATNFPLPSNPKTPDASGKETGKWQQLTVTLVQDYPTGFPKTSCFLDSDDAFMVYRRFGCVYSRLLLSKQDEMSRMEATLLAMDRTDEADGKGEYLMSRPLDVEREHIPETWEGLSRVELLGRMEGKALEYGESLQPENGTAALLLRSIRRRLGSERLCSSRKRSQSPATVFPLRFHVDTNNL